MGHHAGWITLYAGMAGGADVILIPELGFDHKKVNNAILERTKRGKPYSIVAIAEGLKINESEQRPAAYISQIIERDTQIETRETVLGYVQRGGSPSAFDRNLGTRLGGYATELIAKGMFGKMVSLQGDKITSIPLKETSGKLKLVSPDHDLILQGKRMGISFGI